MDVCCTVAKRFREIVDTKVTEAQDESFWRRRSWRSPSFFMERAEGIEREALPGSSVGPLLPHASSSHAAKGHAPEEEVIEEEESSDEEYLDRCVWGRRVLSGEDEDGDTGRVPSGDELESDEESLSL